MQTKYKTTIRLGDTQIIVLTDEPPTRQQLRGALIPVGQLLIRNSIPGEVKPLRPGKNVGSLMQKNYDGPDYEIGTVVIEQSTRGLD